MVILTIFFQSMSTVYILSNFFHLCLTVFIVQVFTSLVTLILSWFTFFDATVSSNVFLISLSDSLLLVYRIKGLPRWLSGKEFISNAGDAYSMATHSSILAREIYEQRSLVGYSPWRCKRVRHNLVTKQYQQYRNTLESLCWFCILQL